MTQAEMERADAQVMFLVNNAHSQKVRLEAFRLMMAEQDRKDEEVRRIEEKTREQLRKEERKERMLRKGQTVMAVVVSILALVAMMISMSTGALPGWFVVTMAVVLAVACGVFVDRRMREGRKHGKYQSA